MSNCHFFRLQLQRQGDATVPHQAGVALVHNGLVLASIYLVEVCDPKSKDDHPQRWHSVG